jgi:hypothetical protein
MRWSISARSAGVAPLMTGSSTVTPDSMMAARTSRPSIGLPAWSSTIGGTR